jgi:hypothetical protein
VTWARPDEQQLSWSFDAGNWKSETNPNTQEKNCKAPLSRLEHWDLGFRICFGFRISDFGLISDLFRISDFDFTVGGGAVAAPHREPREEEPFAG